MSLDGAKLNFVNASGVAEAHIVKGRKFNVGSFLGCDLVLPDAERIHCEIECDAFGRVTIHNFSSNAPILLNDQIVQARAKRPLLHGSRIKILNENYTWYFPRSEDRITPDRTPPEQTANSSPTVKGHQQRRQFDNRLTVHNFRYSINSDDEGNTSIEAREIELNPNNSNEDTSITGESERSTMPLAKGETDQTLPKVDLLEATQNKENSSTLEPKLMLQLCARSDVVITSFSPRETGVKIEKSFTRVLKPSTGLGVSSLATTPKSVYNTPKSVLSELNDDSCSRDLMEFGTPSTSQKALIGYKQSSMHLIDLTTPQRLRPTLGVTPKQAPDSASVISVNSTGELSDDSPIVIDITNSSTPATLTPQSKLQQQRSALKTPREQLLAASSTPKRTPQSLMKRALLTSAKKQIPANSCTPATPQPTASKTSLLARRRQCLTAPRRLPFHPQPQWRTIGRRQRPSLTTNAPHTSPRKRQSVSLSNPRDNKISQLRKSLAAAAKVSPTVGVGMSNKLVTKARRALASPNQDSPKRIASPKMNTPNANETEIDKSLTLDPIQNSSAELSRTFIIEDDDDKPEKNTSASALELISALIENEDAVNNSGIALLAVQSVSRKFVESINISQSKATCADKNKTGDGIFKESNPNNDAIKEALDKTYELKVFQANANLELSNIVTNNQSRAANAEQSPKEKVASESITVEKSTSKDGVMISNHNKSIELEKTKEKLTTESSNAGEADDVIDDSICDEVPTSPTPQDDMEIVPVVHLAEDTMCEELPTSEEKTPTADADFGDNEQDDMIEVAPPGQTPIPRRSLRRLSTEQNAVCLTPRRSTRRASMEANKIELCSKPTRRASCTATVESQPNTFGLATPKRNRRLTEELSTPTRRSHRKIVNTSQKTLEMDESVSDMGVILEEDVVQPEADKLQPDENYGTELISEYADEPDKIDYHGMRELLKTPKSCSTPRFKGLRELVRTPKEQTSAILGNIEEMLENTSATPKRLLTVCRASLNLTQPEAACDAQELYFKTPRGKNLMIPNEPASAILKTRDNALATATEYDLNATNATLHLDKIFDDILVADGTDPAMSIEQSEDEMNVTAISVATAPDINPLSLSTTTNVEPGDTAQSEALMSICSAETSHKDPLTSTAYKPGCGANLGLSSLNDENSTNRAGTPNITDMSGIQLLDQTTDSMFSEPLIVTGTDSFDMTLDETRATGILTIPNLMEAPKKDVFEENSDVDSTVGLAEPLVVSDDDETEVEESASSRSEQFDKHTGNVSTISAEKGKTDHISMPKNESVARYIDEKFIKIDDLLSAENDLESGLEPMKSPNENECVIDLEASTLTTAPNESLAKIDLRKSFANLDQSIEILENTGIPAENSLIKVINIIQDVSTNKEESIIELDVKNAAKAKNVKSVVMSANNSIAQLDVEGDNKDEIVKDLSETFKPNKEDEQFILPTEELPADDINVNSIDTSSIAKDELQEPNPSAAKELKPDYIEANKSSEHLHVQATAEGVGPIICQLETDDKKEDEVLIEVKTSREGQVSQITETSSPETKHQIIIKITGVDDSVIELNNSAHINESIIEKTPTIEAQANPKAEVNLTEKMQAQSDEVEEDEDVTIALDEVLNEISTNQNENVVALEASCETNEVSHDHEAEMLPEELSLQPRATLKTSTDGIKNKSEDEIKPDAINSSEDVFIEHAEIIPGSSEESEDKDSNILEADVGNSLVKLDHTSPEVEAFIALDDIDEQLSSKKSNQDPNVDTSQVALSRPNAFLEASLSKVISNNEDESSLELDVPVVSLSTSTKMLQNEDKAKNETQSNNVDESLIELNESAVIETDEEEGLEEQATKSLSACPSKEQNNTQLDNSASNLIDSIIELNASEIYNEEDVEEHVSQISSTSELPSSSPSEDHNKIQLTTNADESVIELDPSAITVVENEEVQPNDFLSTPAEQSSKPTNDNSATNIYDSAIELNPTGAEEIDMLEEHLCENISISAVSSSSPSAGQHKSQLGYCVTNVKESMIELDTDVAKNDLINLHKQVQESVPVSDEKSPKQIEDAHEIESTNGVHSLVALDGHLSDIVEISEAEVLITNKETLSEPHTNEKDKSNQDNDTKEKLSVIMESPVQKEDLADGEMIVLDTSIQNKQHLDDLHKQEIPIQVESQIVDEKLLDVNASCKVVTAQENYERDSTDQVKGLNSNLDGSTIRVQVSTENKRNQNDISTDESASLKMLTMQSEDGSQVQREIEADIADGSVLNVSVAATEKSIHLPKTEEKSTKVPLNQPEGSASVIDLDVDEVELKSEADNVSEECFGVTDIDSLSKGDVDSLHKKQPKVNVDGNLSLNTGKVSVKVPTDSVESVIELPDSMDSNADIGSTLKIEDAVIILEDSMDSIADLEPATNEQKAAIELKDSINIEAPAKLSPNVNSSPGSNTEVLPKKNNAPSGLKAEVLQTVESSDKILTDVTSKEEKAHVLVGKASSQTENKSNSEAMKTLSQNQEILPSGNSIDTLMEPKVTKLTRRGGKTSKLTESKSEASEMEPTKSATNATVTEEHQEALVMEKPKLRGRKSTDRIIKSEEKTQLNKVVEPERYVEKALEVDSKINRRRSESAAEDTTSNIPQKDKIDLEKPKRRGRKPSAEVKESQSYENEKTIDSEKFNRRGQKLPSVIEETKSHVDIVELTDSEDSDTHVETVDVEKTETHLEQKETAGSEKPKRHGQKHPMVDDTKTPAHHEDPVHSQKPKRRGRKPSEETQSQKSIDLEKPKLRGQKHPANDEITKSNVEPKEATDLENAEIPVETEEINKSPKTETPVDTAQKTDSEKHKTLVEEKETIDLEKLKRREREASQVDETDLDKPKRRKRKASADPVETEKQEVVDLVAPIEDQNPELIKEKPKRRGRKPSTEVFDAVKTAEVKEKKVMRNTRKALADLDKIDESAEPEQKKLRVEMPPDTDAEQQVKRRGRKKSLSVEVVPGETVELPQEIVVASGSREKSSTRRGRKVPVDTNAPSVQQAESVELKPKRRGQKAAPGEVHTDDQPLELTEKLTRRGRKPSADIDREVVPETEPAVEKKPVRRGRKPSTYIETPEATPQSKKPTGRRGRKASLSADTDEVEKQLDVQSLSTPHIEPATVDITVAVSPRTQPPSSEDELTPRRREGRNLPRKNYDETSDEDKHGSSSSRKARKPATIKATTGTPAKPAEIETKPTTPLPTTVPEKAVDPMEPQTPIVITISLPEGTSSQKREGRNVPRKNYNETWDDEKPATSRGRRARQPTVKALELLMDSTTRSATPKRRKGKLTSEADAEEPPAKKITEEDATPVAAKTRGPARRKVQEVDVAVTETDITVTAPITNKRVARSRKESATNQVEETDVDAKQPAKRNVRGNTRKAKAADVETDVQPVTKKVRGGARAKTPALVEPEKANDTDEPIEVPATKRAAPARGRAASRNAKTADDTETTGSQVAAPTARTGRGRKVHFEATEDAKTAATQEQKPAAAEAPKRATRSRRK